MQVILGPVHTPSTDDMPIDDPDASLRATEAARTISPVPRPIAARPAQPPRAYPLEEPHNQVDRFHAANGDTTNSTTAFHVLPTAPPGPARSDKRPQVPTGVSGAPQRKMRPAPPPVSDAAHCREPGQRLRDTEPRPDHAPFWGYDLLALRKGTRFLQWHPGPEPLSPMDRAGPTDRFGRTAGRLEQGGPSHVHEGAADEHHPLLRDMAMLCMNRAWDTNTWLETTNHLCAIMNIPADRDPREENISPVSDTSPRPKQQPDDTLPLHVASKGIGTAGSIPISPEIWHMHLPRDMKRALHVAPDLGDSDDQALAVLSHAMHKQGLLVRCPHGTTAKMRAFPKPKSQEKGALCLLNALMGDPPRPFELPSMAQLAALLELLKARNIKEYFTKLDVPNMFWSVLHPLERSTSFRFHVRGITYAIPSLPFGRSKCWRLTSPCTFRGK